MNEQPVVIGGVVRPDGSLELDGKVPLSAGRVTVTVQALSNEEKAKAFQALLERIWADRKAAGLVPRTREEIDADIEEMRNGFDREELPLP